MGIREEALKASENERLRRREEREAQFLQNKADNAERCREWCRSTLGQECDGVLFAEPRTRWEGPVGVIHIDGLVIQVSRPSRSEERLSGYLFRMRAGGRTVKQPFHSLIGLGSILGVTEDSDTYGKRPATLEEVLEEYPEWKP